MKYKWIGLDMAILTLRQAIAPRLSPMASRGAKGMGGGFPSRLISYVCETHAHPPRPQGQSCSPGSITPPGAASKGSSKLLVAENLTEKRQTREAQSRKNQSRAGNFMLPLPINEVRGLRVSFSIAHLASMLLLS